MTSTLNPEAVSLGAAALGLALTAVLTVPAGKAILGRFVNKGYRRLASELYEDEDGVATEESVAAFSDRWQKYLIILLSIAGFALSVARALLNPDVYPDQQHFVQLWLLVASWSLLLVHPVALFLVPSPTDRFQLGIYGFLASFLAAAVPVVQLYISWSTGRLDQIDGSQKGLIGAEFGAAFVLAVLYTLLPRRPDVFHNGKLVDRQFTTTLLERIIFSWGAPLLQYCVKNRGLDLDDLHVLHNRTRSKTLRAQLERRKQSRKLWKALFATHWKTLMAQHILTVIQAFLAFAPQTALLGILRSLEARGTDSYNPVVTWLWVIGLGVLMMTASTVEGWLWWFAGTRLAIPIQVQLGATVFAKSMRRKDIKGTKKKDANAESGTTTPNSATTSNDEEEDEDEVNQQKTRQSIINLVAVDSKRIAEAMSWNYILPSALMKIGIAFAYLISLLGWWATLAGFAVSILVLPANIYAADKYTSSQTNLMKCRDQKTAIVTEVLQGIRQIKFSALEVPWEKRIGEIRRTELRAQWTAFLYDLMLITIWILGPIMLSAVSLAVYATLHGGLSASIAFTSIAIFGSLEMSLAVLPELIGDFIEAWVSICRIDKHLESPEKKQAIIPHDKVAFEDASVAWPADDDTPLEERFVLRNLNLQMPTKGLTVISGKTGSGKSLLLASILGETDILNGVIKTPQPPLLSERFDERATDANWVIDSAIAYVSQTPWIENASIRDNILFGLPFNESRYRKVIHACALTKDLEMFTDGEFTDIGANGINLSGGQKWRVSFARALYSRAGILVLDDIFSAVDAHTGRHLYEQALTGELGQGRTRILVTHHVALCLPRTDYAIFLEDGTAKYVGTIDELRQSGALSSILVKEQENEYDRDSSSSATPVNEDEDPSSEHGATLQKVLSNRSRRDSVIDDSNAPPKAPPKKFVEEERREIGSVKMSVYKRYIQNGGGIPYWLIVLLIYLAYMFLWVGRSWWVNVWTGSASTKGNIHPSHQHVSAGMYSSINQITFPRVDEADDFRVAEQDNDLWFYLGIYVALSVIACAFGTLRWFSVLRASIQASRHLFDHLAYAVLRAPLRWLDTMPVGRILNRFTADFHLIDSRLGYDVGFVGYHFLEVVGIIMAGVLVSPVLIIFATILLGVCIYYAAYYLAGAREVKRLESTAKSPIFEQFGSALIGLTTIRAFTKSDVYVDRMYHLIDRYAQTTFYIWLFNRWFSFRMNAIGALFSSITAALIVSIHGITASLAGFALSFALQYTGAITLALRQYSNLELDMNATERVIEYSNIPIESQGGGDVPASWPTEGKLEVENLVVGYAPDLPPVLKGLNFKVESNQRVGVVGRTGAGKSSLTLALFRFLEAREGRVVIDGIDISKIKLHDLRSRLAIIPQDPVLFSGTIRSNLDPFDEHSDDELYDALERVHLMSRTEIPSNDSGTSTPTSITQKNTNIFKSLDSPIAEGGQNLSQGQRQLLCLARAIISRPKIMVLDEATSAVDMSTDALIQRSIRSEFSATTLLVIAHRLSTIVDFDRILVMDAGKAVEFGTPKELMEIENGVFRSLVEESGERKVLEEIIYGERNPHLE